MNTDKNKFIISIKGLQTYEDDENNTDISLLTEADFEYNNGAYFIDYEESELTGLEGTKTSIEIGDNYVSLQRSGTVNTNMLFMKDRKTSSYYSTPYGDMQIDIFTDYLNIDVTPKGGKINVDYFIDINNLSTGKNNFEIEIKQAEIAPMSRA
ncbi:MAG: DUF1934 domain-containing protein [Clostridia bacterium]|nr:DUF1934 domain-containing protein [Clostridia bacterium]